MIAFLTALVVFVGLHVAPAATRLKAAAVGRVGRRAYLIVYSLLSSGALAAVVITASSAPYIEIWPYSSLGAWAALSASLAGCVMIALGAARPNALSVSFVPATEPPAQTEAGVLAITAHPVLWGFALWAGGHLAANGDLVSAILFGGLLAFSLVGMRVLERRAERLLGPAAMANWRAPRDGPTRTRLSSLVRRRVALEALAGVLLFAALLAAHPWAIGVDPLATL